MGREKLNKQGNTAGREEKLFQWCERHSGCHEAGAKSAWEPQLPSCSCGTGDSAVLVGCQAFSFFWELGAHNRH